MPQGQRIDAKSGDLVSFNDIEFRVIDVLTYETDPNPSMIDYVEYAARGIDDGLFYVLGYGFEPLGQGYKTIEELIKVHNLKIKQTIFNRYKIT